MTKLADGLAIRAYDKEGDTSYIASTFLKSCRNLAMFAGTPDRLWFSPMEKVLEKFMRHKAARTAIVCDEDDPDYIVAWCHVWLLERTTVIWYCYTRAQHRRKGICNHLIESMPGTSKAAVFTSKIGHRISQKKHIVRYPTLLLEL